MGALINQSEGHPGATGARADQEAATSRFARLLQPWLLALIACDLALFAVRLITYRAYFSVPGALGYVAEPVIPLILYAAVVVALPRITKSVAGASVALRVALVFGLLGGAVESVSTALESLFAVPQHLVSATTLTAMFTLFLLFGVAGFVAGQRAGSFPLGLAAAIGSAMLAILVVVAFGFLLVNIALPTLAHGEIHDPDFLRSGWTDPRAFAIANTFDAGFTHLVEAPVIAAILGSAGSAIGRLQARRRSAPRG